MGHLSIKSRIYWSFGILASLFVINGFITIVTLTYNQKLSTHITEVTDPSLQSIYDFRQLLEESEMYSTNWVFFKENTDDKTALQHLHTTDYPTLKVHLSTLSVKWADTSMKDTLAYVMDGFDVLILEEKGIMRTLSKPEDYENTAKRSSAEHIIEHEVNGNTDALLKSIDWMLFNQKHIRAQEEARLINISIFLRLLISALAILTVIFAIIFSVYLGKIIIKPINKIIAIVNDLGMGKIKKVDHYANGDEMGRMIKSINNLSENLCASATFASEIGNRNFTESFEPLSEEDVLGNSLIAMRDSLKTSDEALNAKNTELQKTSTELDRFVYSVSHDLRAPLTSMLGIIQLSEQMSKEPLILKHLGMLRKSANKLDSFILDILDYSRNARMEVKKEEIHFNEILEDIASSLKFMGGADSKVTISSTVSNGIIFKSDKVRLTVLLNNLISNAIRYQNPKEEKPFVDTHVTVFEHEAVISIKDNGIGISTENQQKVFEMFYRVSTSSVGSGLGLYIVKETIDKLEGKISLESVLNEGTTFTLHIPNSK